MVKEAREMKHEGFYKDRLKKGRDNPREVAFADQWIYENQDGKRNIRLLGKLIPNVTQRDAEVVATIIQWLGSNVGMSFIFESMRREPGIKKWLGL